MEVFDGREFPCANGLFIIVPEEGENYASLSTRVLSASYLLKADDSRW